MKPGTVGINAGPMMAAADRFTVEITGRGGHGAHAYQTVDVVLVAAHIITAAQIIVSRNVRPIDSAVPGAGATLGADSVAKARPDGYTLLVGAVHHTIATSVYKKLNYDFQKSFAPITTVALVPNVLAVSAATPAKDVKELVALIKATPNKFSYGSNGAGTAQHLIGTQFERLTGTDLVHIPYKGSGPLATDLLGGQVTMSFDTVTPVLPHIKAGKLRALAVTTAKRPAAAAAHGDAPKDYDENYSENLPTHARANHKDARALGLNSRAQAARSSICKIGHFDYPTATSALGECTKALGTRKSA
eukprot:gene10790-biopygen3507